MEIELQNLDCNCNNCLYMQRDMNKFEQSLINHKRWQLDYFNTIKNNLITKAKWWLEKQENQNKHDALIKEANKMRFQFDKSTCAINFGFCNKKDINVSFIPNTLQLNTQGCFENRKK